MDFSPFYLVVEMKKNGAELLWCFFRGGNKGQTKQTLLLHIGANKN